MFSSLHIKVLAIFFGLSILGVNANEIFEANHERNTTITLAEERQDFNNDNDTLLSPAQELIRAAKAAGYELTLERFDEAEAATDEEVVEMMPAPVAEAFISLRQRDNFDVIRERMIGMVFTGKPQPLGIRPRFPPPRRSQPPLPPRHNPHSRFHVNYNPQGEASIQSNRKVPAPQEILKPLPFEPGPTMVKFPPHRLPQNGPPTRQSQGPPKSRPPFKPIEDFSNTLGPDFGPVTFSEIGGNSFGFQDNFKNEFEFGARPGPPTHGLRPPVHGSRPPAHSSRPPPLPPHSSRPPTHPPRPPTHPPRPPPSRPSRPTHTEKVRPSSRPRPGGFSNSGFGGGRGSSCLKYTEDICLDSEDYPHEAILSSLVRDPSRADTMVAEVRSQSADELIDGVSKSQEDQYDYQHYFGNRRAGTDSHAHRDFAQDGGFLCPSEVKYARPKRARNSKGSWKYVVNMDKYSQTIRMEKCLKPGGACSYVSHHYRATCNQVYNYHRLLSWEDGRGLHMDIFKVPSCCSCHIQGYAYIFPPLGRHQNSAGSNQVTRIIDPPDILKEPEDEDIGSTRNLSPIDRGIIRRRPGLRNPGQRRPSRDNNSELHSRTQLVEDPHPNQTNDQRPMKPVHTLGPRDQPPQRPIGHRNPPQTPIGPRNPPTPPRNPPQTSLGPRNPLQTTLRPRNPPRNPPIPPRNPPQTTLGPRNPPRNPPQTPIGPRNPPQNSLGPRNPSQIPRDPTQRGPTPSQGPRDAIHVSQGPHVPEGGPSQGTPGNTGPGTRNNFESSSNTKVNYVYHPIIDFFSPYGE